MKNPYLKPQSHRANMLSALFALLALKLAAVFLDFHLNAGAGGSALMDPNNLIILGTLALAFIFDLIAVYHLTTRWHRLDRHAWIIFPSPLLNLAFALLLIIPGFFAITESAIASLLGDSPWIHLATWIAVAAAALLAILELLASLRLIRRLHQPLARSF
jgi:hypothetical protein